MSEPVPNSVQQLDAAAAKRMFADVLGGPTPAPAAQKWVAPECEELAPLFPKYEFLNILGRGGMGAVYLAKDKELHRQVAIKILPPELANQPGFQERFRREAQALAKLDHPNIVLIHELATTAKHL